MKALKITDITIRDIFQSTRPESLDSKTFDLILKHLSKVNYNSLEVLGGSSFERMLESNLYMSPFEIVSHIKKKVPSIPLQALIGARNLSGLEVYSKGFIAKFIKQCIKSGISIFRVYDSLNDFDNASFTIKTIVENGAKCQGTIIYDGLENIDFYLRNAAKLQDLGCESICIKDVESMILPKKASSLFSSMHEGTDLPLFFSASNLRGLQALNYFEACTNGCDGVDLSFLPSYYNDLNSSVFPFLLSLKGSEVSYDIDYPKAVELSDVIKKYIYPYIKQDLFSTKFILDHSNKNLMPKWLISSIYKQLEDIGETKSIDLVLGEVFKIKNEIGNPSLSTPIGQIIGSQAVLNTVISDYRWEILCDEIKKLIGGYFGKLPRKINEKVASNFEGMNKKEKDKIVLEAKDTYNKCKEAIIDLTDKEEDILSYCLFPVKARKNIEGRKTRRSRTRVEKELDLRKAGVPLKNIKTDSIASLENLDIKKLREITNLVESSNIDDIQLEVDGVKISINSSKTGSRQVAEVPEKVEKDRSEEKAPGIIEVKAPIVGTFYTSPGPDEPPFIKVGSIIKKGDTLCIIEAMKLMNKINSEYSGEVVDILISDGDAVEYGQLIISLKESKK